MFSSKSLRNVPEDHGKQLCAANGCLGNGSLDRKFSAICAQSPRHTEVTHAATGYTGFREAADVCSVFGTETFRDKTIDRTSDGIGSRTTEDILGCWIKEKDAVLHIYGNDRVHGRLHETCETFPALLQRLPRKLPRGDVLGKDKNSFWQSLATSPWPNLPAYPCCAALGSITTIFFGAQRFSGKPTKMELLPSLWDVGENFVMREAYNLRTVKRVIRTPALAHLDIAHITVKHGDRRRHMLDECPQQLFLDL